jgi:DNA-binding NarL/FixJ family response regulator
MNSRKLTIAIVDDHKTTRSILSSFLSKENCIVFFEASTGSELLERLQTTDMIPDVCIVDVNMPEMDGFETVQKLKEKWPGIKILAISGEITNEQIEKIMKMGADGFLSKNSSIKELTDTILSFYENDINNVSPGSENSTISINKNQKDY